jgi:WD40 repeat protein
MLRRTFPIENGNWASSAALSPDRQLLVTASDAARIWNARTGHLRRRLVGHSDVLTDARFSPDGRSIVDGTARVWDAAHGKVRRVLRGSQGDVTAPHSARTGGRSSPRARTEPPGSGTCVPVRFSLRCEGTIQRSTRPSSVATANTSLRGGTTAPPVCGRPRPGRCSLSCTCIPASVNGVAVNADHRIVSASDDATPRIYRCETCASPALRAQATTLLARIRGSATKRLR